LSCSSVTLLIGEPCVGKSAIARAVLAHGAWEFRSVKWVPHHAGRVSLLGVYEDGQQFPGTDRLSMACQPHAVEFCKVADRPVVIEGDRLGNMSFITALRMNNIALRIGHVVCDREILVARRAAEREQSEKFVRSRQTKIANIIKWGGHVTLTNNTPEDVQWNAVWAAGL
jgi:hypothetical protein